MSDVIISYDDVYEYLFSREFFGEDTTKYEEECIESCKWQLSGIARLGKESIDSAKRYLKEQGIAYSERKGFKVYFRHMTYTYDGTHVLRMWDGSRYEGNSKIKGCISMRKLKEIDKKITLTLDRLREIHMDGISGRYAKKRDIVFYLLKALGAFAMDKWRLENPPYKVVINTDRENVEVTLFSRHKKRCSLAGRLEEYETFAENAKTLLGEHIDEIKREHAQSMQSVLSMKGKTERLYGTNHYACQLIHEAVNGTDEIYLNNYWWGHCLVRYKKDADLDKEIKKEGLQCVKIEKERIFTFRHFRATIQEGETSTLTLTPNEDVTHLGIREWTTQYSSHNHLPHLYNLKATDRYIGEALNTYDLLMGWKRLPSHSERVAMIRQILQDMPESVYAHLTMTASCANFEFRCHHEYMLIHSEDVSIPIVGWREAWKTFCAVFKMRIAKIVRGYINKMGEA